MICVPTADRALVFINGTPSLIVTGSSLTFTGDGDLIISPPQHRVEFHRGHEVEQEPGAIRLYRRDGTVAIGTLGGLA